MSADRVDAGPRTRTPARTTAIVALVAIVPLLVLLATQIGSESGTRRSRLIDQPVPAFELPVLDSDETVSSDDLVGTTYLVNFWNDWCVPCRQEHPALVAFHEAHADDPDVRLIGIVRDENSLADIREYVADQGVEWTILLDPDGRAKIGFGTTGQPETFAVGPDGVVRDVFVGPASLTDLETMAANATRAAGSATADGVGP